MVVESTAYPPRSPNSGSIHKLSQRHLLLTGPHVPYMFHMKPALPCARRRAIIKFVSGVFCFFALFGTKSPGQSGPSEHRGDKK